MSIDSQKVARNHTILEFKSSTFSVPVLILSGNDLDVIEEQLNAKIKLAPEFFKNSPLVLDLNELNKQDTPIELEHLIEIIRKLGLLPIGLRGGSQQQNTQILGLGIPIYSHSSSVVTAGSSQKQKNLKLPPQVPEEKSEPIGEQASLNSSTTLVTQPVRSGQRIYSSGDLVILAQVSAGAEVMAEGNIHVYSVLRGRALAGVHGNLEARIFCSDLQAELISIAGTYKVSEDLDETVRNKPVQVYLQKDNLIIKDIL
jgi:septum site-determining protein MinC